VFGRIERLERGASVLALALVDPDRRDHVWCGGDHDDGDQQERHGSPTN